MTKHLIFGLKQVADQGVTHLPLLRPNPIFHMLPIRDDHHVKTAKVSSPLDTSSEGGTETDSNLQLQLSPWWHLWMSTSLLMPLVIVPICLMCTALLNVFDALASHPVTITKWITIKAFSITIGVIFIIDEIQFLIYAIKSVKGRMETYWSPECGTAKALRFCI